MNESRSAQLRNSFWHPPDLEQVGVGQPVIWAGLLATVLPCGLLLLIAVGAGELIARPGRYALTLALYLALVLAIDIRSRLSAWLWRRLWAFLLALSLVCFVLQAQAAESFLQPIVFINPLIYAALAYPPGRVALVALWLLGLMNLGVWLGGEPHPVGYLFPTFGYGTFMAFTFAFVRLSRQQAAARRRADRLAGDLARQRDYLSQLVAITATLTRDLDLATVLSQVAAAGRALAQAGQARVWLAGDEPPGELRLAVAVPAPVGEPVATTSLAGLEAGAGEAGLVLPLTFKGATIGALELSQPAGGFAQADAQLLQPFADAAAVAIENARLFEQSQVSATLTERNRLARELHDTIAQGLTAVTMQIEAAQRSFERDPARARARIGRAHELARATLEDVRRSVWTLAAPLIDGAMLRDELAQATARFAERTGVAASYHHSGPDPALGHAAASQVQRIVQEALQNVEKHARASQVTVASAVEDGALRVAVRDDGAGFAPGQPQANGQARSGFGLLSLRERARLAGGELQVASAPGQGTLVALTIPLGGEGS